MCMCVCVCSHKGNWKNDLNTTNHSTYFVAKTLFFSTASTKFVSCGQILFATKTHIHLYIFTLNPISTKYSSQPNPHPHPKPHQSEPNHVEDAECCMLMVLQRHTHSTVSWLNCPLIYVCAASTAAASEKRGIVRRLNFPPHSLNAMQSHTRQ